MERRISQNGTHNEASISDGLGEVAIEGDSIIVRIVALFSDDMLQKCGLVSENLR